MDGLTAASEGNLVADASYPPPARPHPTRAQLRQGDEHFQVPRSALERIVAKALNVSDATNSEAIELTDADRVADDSFMGEPAPPEGDETQPSLFLLLRRAIADVPGSVRQALRPSKSQRQSFEPILRALVSPSQPWLYLGVALLVMIFMVQILGINVWIRPTAVSIPYRGASEFQVWFILQARSTCLNCVRHACDIHTACVCVPDIRLNTCRCTCLNAYLTTSPSACPCMCISML